MQKEIAQKNIDENIVHKINIKNIRLGVKLNGTDTTLNTANIKTTLINPLGINVNEMVIEIWHSKNENEKPDWDNCETKNISIDEFSISGKKQELLDYFGFNEPKLESKILDILNK